MISEMPKRSLVVLFYFCCGADSYRLGAVFSFLRGTPAGTALKKCGALRRGGRLRARRVAFLRKKLRKNLFGKRFFCAQWGECEHGPPMPEGARPVFAGGKDRQRWAFLLAAHFSLGDVLWMVDNGFKF